MVLNGFSVLIGISDPVNRVEGENGDFSITYLPGGAGLQYDVNDIWAFLFGGEDVHLDSFDVFRSVLGTPVDHLFPL